ncbi:MAG: hypothetical protein ACT4OO_14230 [Nitrospiraceae bacterium]
MKLMRPLLVATMILLVACKQETSSLKSEPWEAEGSHGIDHPGVASRYPGDVGIETHPAVVFIERFDRQSVDDFAQDWSNVKNVTGMTLVPDRAPGAADPMALELTALGGQTSGAHLYHALERNYEELYIRYYVKHAADGMYHHTGGYLGGFNPPSPHYQGLCCHWPEGTYAFSVAFEILVPFEFDFYSYWVEMKRWGEIVTPPEFEVDPITHTVKAKASGNTFMRNARHKVIPGTWQSIEFRVKLNRPVTANNGELSLWIDGTH